MTAWSTTAERSCSRATSSSSSASSRCRRPPAGGALLQVEAVGLCGSDLAQFAGIELIPGGSAFPVVPGHETVGRVVALAPDAELDVTEGDRVAVDEIFRSRRCACTGTPT